MAGKRKKLTETEKKHWYRFKVPGCGNLNRVKVNVIHLSVANSLEHEMAKCKKAYELMKNGEKILTEADEIATGLRRDLISISSGEIFEVEHSKSKRGHRHPSNINVVWYNEQ